jgi:hypothetical protein
VDSISELEQILWQYLINQNKTGLNKLLSNFANSKELIEKLRNLIQTRLQNSNKSVGLEQDIQTVMNEVKNLQFFISKNREGIYEQIKVFVVDRFSNIIAQLSDELYQRESSKVLPSKNQLTDFLDKEAYNVISDVYEHLQQERFKLQSSVNTWVNSKLKQVKLTVDELNENSEFQMPDISKYTSQVYSSFNENTGGYWDDIFEKISGTISEFIAWLFTEFFNAFTFDEKIKEREIKKALKLANKAYSQMQTALLKNVSEYLTGISKSIANQTLDRTNVYLDEQNRLVKELNIPLSVSEKQNYENLAQELSVLDQGITSHYNALWIYTQGIDWLPSRAK